MSKKNTSLWIDENVKTKLKEYCKKKEISIEKAIQNFIEKSLPSEEFHTILLHVPKSLTNVELKTWVQQRSDYLVNKLSKT